LFGTGETATVYESTGSQIGGAEGIFTGASHSGGVIGKEPPTFYRIVPRSAFSDAPRFHKGFASDEYPAILQSGEGVFTPRQMAALGLMAGGGSRSQQVVENHHHYSTEVKLTVHALDSRSVTQTLAQHQSQIVGMINQAYNKIGKRGPLGS